MEQKKLLGSLGKPKGLWYAYGEDWKEYVLSTNTVKNSKRGHKAIHTTIRHEFILPEEVFVSNVAKVSRDTILQLSAANLDAFMKRFVKKKHYHTLQDLLEISFIQMGMENEPGSILTELSREDEKFEEFMDGVQELMQEEMYAELADWMGIDMDKGQIEKGLVHYAFTNFKELLSTYTPSHKAQINDSNHLFDWMAFWDDVSDKVGGVEFENDLFDIDSWKNVWLPWTDKLSIRSGVIFHPSRFRGGILMEQLPSQAMGGVRHTRRKRHQGRKAGKKAGTQRR